MLPVMCIYSTWILILIFQSQMNCITGDCGLPPVIEHTLPVIETSGVHDDTIVYSCNRSAGYYELPDKGKTITCQNDDTWTTISDFCARACGVPERLEFAIPRDSDLKDIYLPGTKVSYDCRLGYRRVPRSDNSITCLDNYTWSIASEFCTYRECGNPGDTDNGEFTATNHFFFGSKVTYSCNEGYRLSSRKPYRDCQADGTWSNTVPQCEAVLCVPPDSPDNGMYNPVKDEYTFQDSVTFECNKGLHVIGATTASCTSDGTWSASSPTCREINCADPGQIQNGRKKSGFIGPYTLNSAVTYECNNNFVMNGSSTVACNVDGQWEHELPQCLTVCGAPPKYDNAELEERFSNIRYFDTTTVFYKCIRGYQSDPTKNNGLTCIGTSWSKQAEVCSPISCGDPGNVENAKRLDSEFTFKSKVYYNCDDGYMRTSRTNYKECQADGSWTSEPVTCAVTCQISNLAGSNQDLDIIVYVENEVVHIECLNGFVMNGTSSVRCNSRGQWEPPLPKCTELPQEGLSVLGKVLIGVGCLIVVATVGGIIWYLVSKKKKSGKAKSNTADVHYVACNDA